jgi:hypothetical protein
VLTLKAINYDYRNLLPPLFPENNVFSVSDRL